MPYELNDVIMEFVDGLTITSDTLPGWENLVKSRVALGEHAIIRFENPTLSPQMVADMVGVTHPTIVRAINNGRLPAVKAGTRWRITKADANKFAADFFTSPGGE